jgi:hypothetical protein
MASDALSGLLIGLAEIEALQRANPTPQQGGGLTKPQVTRAIGRAEVVLLSSHFERYLYRVNEEAAAAVVTNGVPAGSLPDEVRLLHATLPVDELAKTQWNNRAEKLRLYSEQEAALWVDHQPVHELQADRLLAWMKAPTTDSVVRMFRTWGIEDMFAAITRSAVIRGRLRLRIGELVSKRNNIAHGDATVEATYLDVVQYKAAVKKFCTSADRKLARRVASLTGTGLPW